MAWFYIAITAQVILGVSAVFDKWLLKRKFFDPLVYTFWVGLPGILAVFIFPFGFQILPLKIMLVAFASGAIFMFAMYFLFLALSKGEASKIYPLIGGLSPIFTLIAGYILINAVLGAGDLIGFAFLILGAFALFFIEEKHLRWTVLGLVVTGSVLFGISHILSKIVYESAPFIPGYAWIKISQAVFVCLFLVSKKVKTRVFSSTKESSAKNKVLYFSNRAFAAVGSVMVNVAFKLVHPALVDATQSLKYITIFFISWLVLKERFKGKALFGKILATILVVIGLVWLGLVNYSRSITFNPDRPINWGVTFSQKFSRQLGLDWKDNYKAILSELNPDKIRLVAYWEDIEKTPGQYDFSDLDWLLSETNRYSTRVILAVGMKVPRWPECHIPDWAEKLSVKEREEKIKRYLSELISRYKENKAIGIWQAENEPFLNFGECGERPKGFLEDEIKLIKSLDPSRPVLVSDSGEFGLWYKSFQESDIFGTTMYRKVHSPTLEKVGIEVYEYPIGPGFFRLKERIIRRITGDYSKPIIVVELQSEPWDKSELPYISYERQIELFSTEYFADTINYAKAAGYDEYYLWGAEWWYKLKTQNNDNRYWEYVKKLIATSH